MTPTIYSITGMGNSFLITEELLILAWTLLNNFVSFAEFLNFEGVFYGFILCGEYVRLQDELYSI